MKGSLPDRETGDVRRPALSPLPKTRPHVGDIEPQHVADRDEREGVVAVVGGEPRAGPPSTDVGPPRRCTCVVLRIFEVLGACYLLRGIAGWSGQQRGGSPGGGEEQGADGATHDYRSHHRSNPAEGLYRDSGARRDHGWRVPPGATHPRL